MGAGWVRVLEGRAGQDRRVLLVGPPGAGKRSMLQRLRQAAEGPLVEYYRTCKFGSFAINSWDTSATSREARTLYQHYYDGASGLVFVADSSDRKPISEVKQMLAYMLDDPRLANAAVLVFANKQDLDSAMSPADVSQELGLQFLRSHAWHVQGCSVATGEGVRDGWAWLELAFTNRGRSRRKRCWGFDSADDCDDELDELSGHGPNDKGDGHADELKALMGSYVVTSDDLEVTAGEANGNDGFAPWRPWSRKPVFLSFGDYIEVSEVLDCRKRLLDVYGRISSPIAGWIPLDVQKLRRPDFIVNCHMSRDEGSGPVLLCTNLAGCRLAEYSLRHPEDETVEDVLSYLSSFLSIDRRSLKVVTPDGQLFDLLSVGARVMDVFNRK